MTSAPSRANSSAAARPIPFAAAVTTARLPASLPAMPLSLRCDRRTAMRGGASSSSAWLTSCGRVAASMRRRMAESVQPFFTSTSQGFAKRSPPSEEADHLTSILSASTTSR